MSMMSEFKEFAVKGNVMDLAVGVIIGGAFGKIVDSVVRRFLASLIFRTCSWCWARSRPAPVPPWPT